MIKKIIVSILIGLTILVVPATVLAHVIVTPKQAGIGEELTFNVSVPNEQQTPVTNIKLLIPQGVTNVIPTTLPGWTISTASTNSTDITAIMWSNGIIPVGERTDFTFSAQVLAKPGEIDWKAYQTYADGTVIHWDQKPAGSDDSTGNTGPYSVTTVINDLTSTPTETATSKSNNVVPLILSIIAIITSVSGLLFYKSTLNKDKNGTK
jgi:uncharacterized protein YcnI